MENDKDPLDVLLEEEIVSPIGANATAGMMPQTLYATPIPPATKESMVCLRGPCEHYVEFKQRFKHGNSEGTFLPGAEPTATNRFCNLMKGSPTDLTDEILWDCNHWQPIDPQRLADRARARDAWCKANNCAWDARDDLKGGVDADAE